MLSNELVLTVGGPGDRPVPGCRPALSGQQKSPHTWAAGEEAEAHQPAAGVADAAGHDLTDQPARLDRGP